MNAALDILIPFGMGFTACVLIIIANKLTVIIELLDKIRSDVRRGK